MSLIKPISYNEPSGNFSSIFKKQNGSQVDNNASADSSLETEKEKQESLFYKNLKGFLKQAYPASTLIDDIPVWFLTEEGASDEIESDADNRLWDKEDIYTYNYIIVRLEKMDDNTNNMISLTIDCNGLSCVLAIARLNDGKFIPESINLIYSQRGVTFAKHLSCEKLMKFNQIFSNALRYPNNYIEVQDSNDNESVNLSV